MWYNTLATQSNISKTQRLVFTSVKTQPLFGNLWVRRMIASQQVRLCVFRCVASATHFFVTRDEREREYEMSELRSRNQKQFQVL